MSQNLQFYNLFPPFIGIIIICLLGGVLSPLIVLKQRAYLTDTIAHLVFPGIVIGILLARIYHLDNWLCIIAGASTTAIIGTYISEWFLAKLKIPPDSAAIICLSAFFAIGVLMLLWTKQDPIEPEELLFGDILSLTYNNIILLAFVLLFNFLSIFGYRKHWDAWLTDAEFAQVAGFKIQTLNKLFPLLVTISVLAGFLAVGGLMIAAIITMPAVICESRRIISVPTIIFSFCLGIFGFIFAVSTHLPVGPVLVLFGFFIIIVKSALRKFYV